MFEENILPTSHGITTTVATSKRSGDTDHSTKEGTSYTILEKKAKHLIKYLHFQSNPLIFARSDTGDVIDSEPQPSRTCKTRLLFAPLAVVFKLAVPLFQFTLRLNR